MYTTEVIYQGQAFTIKDVAKNGNCTVSTFIEGLPESARR